VSRARRKDPWPYPGDSLADRLKRIARLYRDRLDREAPEACAELDAAVTKLGHGWIRPKLTTVDLDDLLTVAQAADFCDVQPAAIDVWRTRGLKPTDTADGVRYRVRDILDYHAERRQRRAGIRPSTSDSG